MSVRFQIAILVFMMVQAVLFWHRDYHHARNAVTHMTKRIPRRDLPRCLMLGRCLAKACQFGR